MNVKKAVKKLVALGAGAVMMGATIFGAMAADLGDFPEPFVKNGAYNAWIVVGQGAQVADVIGAIDIATRLQYEMKVEAAASAGSAATVTVTGDAARVKTSTDMLEFGEELDDVKEVYTNADLSALASGTFSNNKGSFKYTQQIDLTDTALQVEYTTDSDRDETADYLYAADGASLYAYEVTFPTALESDVDTNNHLDDIEDKSITLLGKSYAITTASISGSDITLELMGGDVSDTLYEGESKIYTISGKEYEVTVSYIGSSGSDTVVKFQVVYDGKTEVTSSIATSDTYVLDDGTEIGVRDALEQNDYSGTQKDFVEFYMGSNKITLTNGDSLEVGSDSMSDASVSFVSTGTDSSDEVTISSFKITVVSPDDVWVPAGGVLSDELDSDEKGVLFTENFDFSYAGLTSPSTEEVSFATTDGNSVQTLTFTNKDGNEYKVPILFTDVLVATSGDEDGILWTTEGANTTAADILLSNVSYDNLVYEIAEDDYFIVSDNSKDDYKRYSYVFQYTDYDSDDTIVTFTEIGQDEEYDVDLSVASGDYLTGDLRVGGKDFTVLFDDSSDKAWVDMDANNAVNETPIVMGLTTKNGIVIGLQNEATVASADEVTVTFSVDDSFLDETTGATTSFTVVSDVKTDDEVYMKAKSGLFEIGDSDTFAAYLTTYGIYVEQDQDSDYNPIEISIPSSELEAQVFLTSGAVESAGVDMEASGSAYTIQPIAVGAAKLDTEASGYKSQNVIVVGGPCANTVAAELMGSPSPCGTGFSAGKAKIKVFDQGAGKVAMLVAGYEAEDTLRAAKVVNEYKKHSDFDGMEIEVSGTSMTDISVSSVN